MPESAYQPNRKREGIALCLSGGGFRAALFHMGSLRRLNETGVLAKVTTITSVSGGSITNGLLAKWWPNFQFKNGVIQNFAAFEAELRNFCAHDIRTGSIILHRLDPRNWPMLWSDDHSATDLLADEYEDSLVGGVKMGDLPHHGAAQRPRFVFCASNLQTGVSFELRADRIGDYVIGYAPAPEMRLADVIAASSAFPLAFPPLVIRMDPARFSGGKLGDSPDQRRFARRILLSDGGVYDNLALEPVWKTHQAVLCSDGGKPFSRSLDPGEAAVPRLLRAQDVIGNQALAVRKRWLVSSFETRLYEGTYWGIGTEIENYPQHGAGYAGEVLNRLRGVRTDLNVFREGEQLVLMNHGWALTDAALRSYGGTLVTHPLGTGVAPDAKLLADPAQALSALT